MSLNYDTTQVKIKELRVLDFFDEKFIEKIQKQFPNLNFQHFCIDIIDEKDDKKKKERLSIGHFRNEDIKNNILTVDTDESQSLQKILKVIEEYVKEKRL